MNKTYNLENCIYEGKVFHSRLRPKKHYFKYLVFYLHINLNFLKKNKLNFLSRNKFNRELERRGRKLNFSKYS